MASAKRRPKPSPASQDVAPGEPADLALEARAAVLVEAAMPGAVDERVAEKWGINRKTIQRWRAAAETDPELREAMARAWDRVDPYKEIGRALLVLVKKATELALMSRSPKDLRAIRDLISVLGEIQVTKDTFIPPTRSPDAPPDRQDPVAKANR